MPSQYAALFPFMRPFGEPTHDGHDMVEKKRKSLCSTQSLYVSAKYNMAFNIPVPSAPYRLSSWGASAAIIMPPAHAQNIQCPDFADDQAAMVPCKKTENDSDNFISSCLVLGACTPAKRKFRPSSAYGADDAHTYDKQYIEPVMCSKLSNEITSIENGLDNVDTACLRKLNAPMEKHVASEISSHMEGVCLSKSKPPDVAQKLGCMDYCRMYCRPNSSSTAGGINSMAGVMKANADGKPIAMWQKCNNAASTSSISPGNWCGKFMQQACEYNVVQDCAAAGQTKISDYSGNCMRMCDCYSQSSRGVKFNAQAVHAIVTAAVSGDNPFCHPTMTGCKFNLTSARHHPFVPYQHATTKCAISCGAQQFNIMMAQHGNINIQGVPGATVNVMNNKSSVKCTTQANMCPSGAAADATLLNKAHQLLYTTTTSIKTTNKSRVWSTGKLHVNREFMLTDGNSDCMQANPPPCAPVKGSALSKASDFRVLQFPFDASNPELPHAKGTALGNTVLSTPGCAAAAHAWSAACNYESIGNLSNVTKVCTVEPRWSFRVVKCDSQSASQRFIYRTDSLIESTGGWGCIHTTSKGGESFREMTLGSCSTSAAQLTTSAPTKAATSHYSLALESASHPSTKLKLVLDDSLGHHVAKNEPVFATESKHARVSDWQVSSAPDGDVFLVLKQSKNPGEWYFEETTNMQNTAPLPACLVIGNDGPVLKTACEVGTSDVIIPSGKGTFSADVISSPGFNDINSPSSKYGRECAYKCIQQAVTGSHDVACNTFKYSAGICTFYGVKGTSSHGAACKATHVPATTVPPTLKHTQVGHHITSDKPHVTSDEQHSLPKTPVMQDVPGSSYHASKYTSASKVVHNVFKKQNEMADDEHKKQDENADDEHNNDHHTILDDTLFVIFAGAVVSLGLVYSTSHGNAKTAE